MSFLVSIKRKYRKYYWEFGLVQTFTVKNSISSSRPSIARLAAISPALYSRNASLLYPLPYATFAANNKFDQFGLLAAEREESGDAVSKRVLSWTVSTSPLYKVLLALALFKLLITDLWLLTAWNMDSVPFRWQNRLSTLHRALRIANSKAIVIQRSSYRLAEGCLKGYIRPELIWNRVCPLNNELWPHFDKVFALLSGDTSM